MTRLSYRPNGTNLSGTATSGPSYSGIARSVSNMSANRFSHQLKQSFIVLVASVGILSVGCGKSEVSTAQTSQASSSSDSAAIAIAPTVSPTDVVSQFLDQVRRGGADANAGRFLTQKAQAELKRIGRSVQPIGSPDAHFDVLRAVPVPEEKDAMLVESRWTEPNPDGTKGQYQVVWSVEQESAGWRISGLAMELDGSEDPMVIDFENGTLMAELLAEEPSSQENPPAQAAVPSEGLNR